MRYYSFAMSPDEPSALADTWIGYWHAPNGSPERMALSEGADLYDLEYDDPETLWPLILIIQRRINR